LMDAMDDFDFGEEGRPPRSAAATGAGTTASTFISGVAGPSRPVFARSVTAEDGSSLFGGLSSTYEDGTTSPRSPQRHTRTLSSSSLPPPVSPSLSADLATSLSEPLGPGVKSDAHLTDDGLVETVVEGKVIRVPADEIALAHRRSSYEGERPVLSPGLSP